MKAIKPIGSIRHQSQVSLPVTSDTTLVDDTVALVDSATALVGGPATPNVAMPARVRKLVTRIHSKIYR